MNDLLTRKKHSKRIAELRAGIIEQHLFDGLYLESYEKQRKPKKKFRHQGQVRFTRYYPELFYASTDYFGETNETSIINHVSEYLYYEVNKIDEMTGNMIKPVTCFNNTLSIIRHLKNLLSK